MRAPDLLCVLKTTALCALLFTGAAGAQGLGADPYVSGLDAGAIFMAESAALPGAGAAELGAEVGYQKDSLRYHHQARVPHRLSLRLGLSYSFTDAVQLGVAVPFILQQQTEQVGLQLPQARREGTGPVRLAVKLRLLRQPAHGVGVTIIPAVRMPSSERSSHFGEAHPVVEPKLAVSGAVARLRWNLNLGYRARRALSFGDARLDDELLADLGLSYHLSPDSAVRILAGLSVATAAAKPLSHDSQATYWEAFGAVRYTLPNQAWFGQLSAGSSLQEAPSAPAHRVTLSLGFSLAPPRRAAQPQAPEPCPIRPEDAAPPGCAPLDPDEDGVLGADDRCPDQAGPPAGRGCPDADRDGDGVVDRLDACPTQPEDKDHVDDADGCPEAGLSLPINPTPSAATAPSTKATGERKR